MLDGLDVVSRGPIVEVFIRGAFANDKASGHNQFSGGEHPTLPVRRFIPFDGDGQRFDDDIEEGIKNIVSRYSSGDSLDLSNLFRQELTADQESFARQLLGALNRRAIPVGDFDDGEG